MTLEYKKSLKELNTILNYMNVEYLNKIPTKFINFINNNMDIDYIPNIDKNMPINKQNLSKDTKVLLSLIYRNYWCDSEIKEKLLHEDLIEKKKHEKELQEIYNPDNLFIKRTLTNTESDEKNVSMVQYKNDSWYIKIINKIKQFFKKLKKN